MMVSFEFTDWRNGVFYWVQFLETENNPEIFEALLTQFKIEAGNDEECKGLRSIYENKFSSHWEKIDKSLELDKSHYYLYHIDTI
mmetsp:Transcript_24913/g.22105  ORF Transcript_24913/g.22105 Transcript_24913/m.22105 type:complete len:85 (+) Transcript_24913:243-497(+)